MSGHSKWATIRHKKGRADAARGRIFTRLIKEITVSARMGGGDETSNPRLRSAIAAAKAQNMPAANIDRAIKKGTGELEGVEYLEITYEGYGPGGVALIIEVVTDNKNRTVAEIRNVLAKNGGNLGENGCVAWNFDTKGVITLSETDKSEEELMEMAIEAGAEDLRSEDGTTEIFTDSTEIFQVEDQLKSLGLNVESSAIKKLPKDTVSVEGKTAEQVLNLLEKLDDHDDVQQVFCNFDMDESLLAAL